MQSEIDELVRDINEHPDKLHGDYTPAVHRLVEIGEQALGAALELLLSGDEATRMRAQRVLEGVTMRMHGFRSGHGWDSERGEDEWRTFWKSLGDLDYEASQESRAQSVERWRQWLKRSEGV